MSDLLAYHESGHALMAWLLGGEVERVTIEPDNDDGPAREGDTQVLWRREPAGPREFADKTARVCLAGPVAEMIYRGDSYRPGCVDPAHVAEWAADWRQAWAAALLLHADERRRLGYLERVSLELHRLFHRDEIWTALASLADHLAAHETLDGEQVSEICAAWLG